MTARDDTTLGFYAAEAQPYASRSRAADEERLNAFLARLPSGARILELGCGGGQDSEWMLARGFDVTPTDGSPELAREAEKRLGRPVRVLLLRTYARTPPTMAYGPTPASWISRARTCRRSSRGFTSP